MSAPIRITFRENADHFAEAFAQMPFASKPLLPEKTQNGFIALIIGGTFVYFFFSEFKKSGQILMPLLAIGSCLVILAFWFWLFKKIGLFRQTYAGPYQWTEKDKDRWRQAYRKQTGVEENLVTCEIDDAGFRFQLPAGPGASCEWSAIQRAAERPAGLFVFIGKRTFYWFPKHAFASEKDYDCARELLSRKVADFKSLKIADMAIVALGSNLGLSLKNILEAENRLQQFSDIPVLKSSLWETSPVDCPPDSPKFVNAIVAFQPRANETPESLLKKLQALEKEFGRRPKKIHNEARPLDLDLIAFGSETRRTPALTLPHPRAHERKFVLQPLSEIAPDLILAGQGKTVLELLNALATTETILRVE